MRLHTGFTHRCALLLINLLRSLEHQQCCDTASELTSLAAPLTGQQEL